MRGLLIVDERRLAVLLLAALVALAVALLATATLATLITTLLTALTWLLLLLAWLRIAALLLIGTIFFPLILILIVHLTSPWNSPTEQQRAALDNVAMSDNRLIGDWAGEGGGGRKEGCSCAMRPVASGQVSGDRRNVRIQGRSDTL